MFGPKDFATHLMKCFENELFIIDDFFLQTCYIFTYFKFFEMFFPTKKKTTYALKQMSYI